jgi:hypothetical protein
MCLGIKQTASAYICSYFEPFPKLLMNMGMSAVIQSNLFHKKCLTIISNSHFVVVFLTYRMLVLFIFNLAEFNCDLA